MKHRLSGTLVFGSMIVIVMVSTAGTSRVSSGPYDSPLPTVVSPLPTPTIAVGDLPPIEHGHRHFERPARPIMPTATPMPEATQEPEPTATWVATIVQEPGLAKTNDTQLSVNAATSLTPRAYLPIVMKGPYRSVKVFAIAYIDTAAQPQDIDNVHNQLIADLTSGSKWHGYSILNSEPAFVYSTHISGVVKLYEGPPHQPSGLFDYDAVYQRFNLCAKIQAGEADEVWIWESGTSNSAEFVVNGNTWNAIPAGYSVPNCGRTVATFNVRYDLTVNYALHSYNHRVEDAFLRFNVSGPSTCDFITATGPAPSRRSGSISDPNCVGSLSQSDQFGFIARPMATNNNVSVCGDVHFPPNITPPWTPTNEYIYWSTNSVSSRCQNWQWDSAVQPSSLDCNTWGCNERQYQIWWMQNVPGLNNNNRDRNNNIRSVWWDYLWK